MLLYPFSLWNFYLSSINLYLGQSCGQPSEGCFLPEWGLSRCSIKNFVSLCFAHVNIHESQTPDPHRGKNKWLVCLFGLFLLLQLLAVHELFKEVMENRILILLTNKQENRPTVSMGPRKALLMKSEPALSGDFLQFAFQLTNLQAHSLAFQAPVPSGLLTTMTTYQ